MCNARKNSSLARREKYASKSQRNSKNIQKIYVKNTTKKKNKNKNM